MASSDVFDITVPLVKNLNNNVGTYLTFIELYHTIYSNKNKKILLDFKGVNFFSANLLALFGCCVDNAITVSRNHLAVTNLHPKIKEVMQKNGFNRYFTWEKLKDNNHSTMDYAIFGANTTSLELFERYLIINVFSRQEMPSMNTHFKDRIVDAFLEIFNNVIDHADCRSVYVCGQYFPKSSTLSFSIVDIGKTINENVKTYLTNQHSAVPPNTIVWAVQPGNSTKADTAPGGLGFSILIDFLKLNNGSFILISDDEIYEINKKKERFNKISPRFPGTIVTITINLKDDHLYYYDNNQNNVIVF